MKIGMVLEGGGMRGLYTTAVLDVLMEQELWADSVLSVSAGATFGCNYKSKQIGRALRYNLKYCKDPRYNSLRSLIKTGDLFGAEFCYKTIPNELDIFDTTTYQNNPMDFAVTCTDVQTGKPVYHLCNKGDEEDIRWIRASASLPIVARVVEIDGRGYLDGGLSDSIPLRAMQNKGFPHNMVILTQPLGYRKSKTSMLPLLKLLMRRYPAIIRCAEERHLMYNEELDYIAQCEKEGHTYVLRTSIDLHIKRAENDPERLQAMYDLGRKDALAHLAEIKDFFAEVQK